ncbi:MAG: alkyl hydroperoxide reductase/Thiol specific antioxidant/Mal allergen [Candidatus Acidoferrum typicum]|nr:alkyl hydroperoxide reductase/Thiol specific antioxidant/Mal allergen [Candidatus Acidoferrum typicum]
MKLLSKTCVAIAVLAIVSAIGFSAAASNAPTVGTAAPDFTLNSQENKAVSLHDFKGKWVVLYFYPKDFTTGCTVEAHNFQRDLAQYEQKNAVIVGVSVQDEDSHQKFCTKEGLSFKLLADTKQEVSTEYDSVMTYNDAKFSARHTFLIDPQGKVQKVWLEVKPDKHSEEVLAALSQLQGATSSK